MRGGVATVVNKLLIPWTSSGLQVQILRSCLRGGALIPQWGPLFYINIGPGGRGPFSWGSPKFYDTGMLMDNNISSGSQSAAVAHSAREKAMGRATLKMGFEL